MHAALRGLVGCLRSLLLLLACCVAGCGRYGLTHNEAAPDVVLHQDTSRRAEETRERLREAQRRREEEERAKAAQRHQRHQHRPGQLSGAQAPLHLVCGLRARSSRAGQ